MSLLRNLLNGIFRRREVEAEMAQELRFHVDSRAQDLERRGLTPAEAARQAQIEFGAVESYKEDCREAQGFRLFDELRGDLRQAFRALRKDAGFTAVAVVSLALGIGVNLTCFAALYAMVLRPFPYPDLERIFTLAETRANSPSQRDPVSPANYLDWQRSNRSFERLAAFREWDANLTGVDRPDHVRAALATSEFFEVLGLAPIMGRVFTAAECEPGRDSVVVVSRGFWQSRLASVPDPVGKMLTLGGKKHVIIGVMPEEFNLPLAAELWAPLALTPAERTDRRHGSVAVVGRLSPGVTQEQAAADLNAIAVRLEQQFPDTNNQRRIRATGLGQMVEEVSSRFLSVLLMAAMFVLLLACTNVASLQIARATARQKETALRRALGASNFRIVRQVLAECVLLGLASAAAGLLLAAWDLGVMRSNIPPLVYRLVAGIQHMRITPETGLFAVVLSILASILCTLPALLQMFRFLGVAGLSETLKEGGRNSIASPTRSRLRSALVIVEVALAFVLLTGAGLMTETLQKILTVKLGYDHTNVLSADVSLAGSEYANAARLTAYADGFLRSLEQTSPEIEAAAVAGAMGPAENVVIEGRANPRPDEPRPDILAASPGYLQTLRLPLLQGRWISEQDGPDAPAVVVLSAVVSTHYWPNANPIGQRIRLRGTDSQWLTVVGVTGDKKQWFFGEPLPAAYLSIRQYPQASLQLLSRSRRDSRDLAPALRRAAEALDSFQPVYNVKTIEQQIYEETSGVRNAARMMNAYAIIAFVLAVAGIYSLSSYFVSQRTREIGVRMSLGASRASILKMVLSQACLLAGGGLAIGLPLSVLLALAMSKVLYGVVNVQPVMFVGLLALLGTAAGVAGYIPAYRAARVDPVVALRDE